MPSLKRNGKVTDEKCGKKTTKIILARHKKRCPFGTFCCAKCPYFVTRSQARVNFHLANKAYLIPTKKTIHKCQLCHQAFNGF